MAKGTLQKGDSEKEIAELKASNLALREKVIELAARLAMHLGVAPEEFWLEDAESDMKEGDEE